MENQTHLSPPWEGLERKLAALFALDKEVSVEAKFSDAAKDIDIRVDNPAKAEALGELLPCEVEFGNVKVAVNVIPCNKSSVASLLRTAFAGNLALKGVTVVKDMTFAEFEPRAVQFWNDDFGTPHGVSTALLETLASETLTGPAMQGVAITSAYIDKEHE